jgi:RNA polymerase sigma factor (sigma-70 family)
MNTKISVFSSTISQHPLLSHDQERTASKQELVLANIRLVMMFARKYTSDPDEYKDFVSEGLIGLMTAAEKYTWREECSFSTYAVFWIRSAINRSMGTVRETIRVPSTYVKKHPDYVRVTHSLEESLSDEENSASLGDIIKDDSTLTPEEDLCRKEEIQRVRGALRLLSSRERNIICRNTGAGKSGEEESLSDIGKTYGISKERVRQIRNTASEKLRTCLSEK